MSLLLLTDVDLLINLILLFQKKLSLKEAIVFSLAVFGIVEAYYYWKNRSSESE
ncbi:hypothetical protein [Acidianus bottle-shaped virus]|uniref:Uncharacterized protein ORF53a n=1 Tax=Acidianus bottle-shaped virus (isolate Italy/Pozzuoli) TaxID=654911 RepID=Y053A_ABVP|nr:hypothetical protein ABV_gp09 [Acidianus bottle-shaped virus]A4ZU95.1 RecName: Full=Uncharacterized protein ORF53a [Acidianus bottle-shaped virus (isolate Pozzuoli)]ABP73399.1 hypothetical protein [Acidianus bottle-shaped virus]